MIVMRLNNVQLEGDISVCANQSFRQRYIHDPSYLTGTLEVELVVVFAVADAEAGSLPLGLRRLLLRLGKTGPLGIILSSKSRATSAALWKPSIHSTTSFTSFVWSRNCSPSILTRMTLGRL